jgi:hypothetical protein
MRRNKARCVIRPAAGLIDLAISATSYDHDATAPEMQIITLYSHSEAHIEQHHWADHLAKALKQQTACWFARRCLAPSN